MAIQTSHLVLREARPSDLAELHVLFTQDETMKYWSNSPHTSISQSKTWLDNMIASPHNGTRDFVIELRTIASREPLPISAALPIKIRSSLPSVPTVSAPTVIGKMGCWNSSEVGFILNATYWGKGYASEALEAVLEHLFNETSASFVSDFLSPNPTLKADVDPRNERCLKFLKKFGFVEYGRAAKTFQTHLGWCDSVYLDLTRERWVKWKRMQVDIGG